ncbi:TetR/AcrR family transcriptional regulator [Cytobacillus sp. Hz8]|uniref:TetR/AcrR family transcriptional regulator n=1 Tax=Cytobacillus sp. Hz8 TaxID=3347168 RepID=UPI0035DEE552
MAPFNQEQLNQIRDERREQIMNSALIVFSRRGIIGTKMSMIADEAGISQGLFYRYFKSKDDIFTTLIQVAIEASLSSIDDLYHADGSPLDKIKKLTESIIDESKAPYFKLILQARNSDGVPEKAKQIIRQYPMEAYVNRLLPLFREGQNAGEIADGNLVELISSYLTVLSGVMVLGEDYHVPQVDILMRIITRGF